MDRQLLDRVSRGETSAFWELWFQYQDYVRRVCLQVGGSDDDVNDIMLKLLESLPVYAGRINNLRSWLGRVARNFCLDRRRREARVRLVSFDENVIMARRGAGSPA